MRGGIAVRVCFCGWSSWCLCGGVGVAGVSDAVVVGVGLVLVGYVGQLSCVSGTPSPSRVTWIGKVRVSVVPVVSVMRRCAWYVPIRVRVRVISGVALSIS